MKRTLVVLFIFFGLGLSANAQVLSKRDTTAKIGLYGGYNMVQYPASFNFFGLDDFHNCCPEFTDGSGGGFTAGALYEYPFNPKLSLQMRIGFQILNGSFESSEAARVAGEGGLPTDGTISHVLDANISALAIQPMVTYRAFGPLVVSAGLNLGLLMGKTYDQREEISPAGFTFLDKDGNDTKIPVRNEESGIEIPDAGAMLFGATIGVGFELPLDKNRALVAVPEVFYNMNFNNISSSLDWGVNNLRAGIAFKYSFPPKCPQGLLLDEFDNCVEPPRELEAEVEVLAVNQAGQELASPYFIVNEYEQTMVQPLLNSIFFEEGSDDIPSQYLQLNNPDDITLFTEMRNFDADDKMKIYYDILNIIGRRMMINDRATLSIYSYNAGGSEKDDKDMPKRRVKAVADYLHKIWRIPYDRMPQKERQLSSKDFNSTDQDKLHENRRVDILPGENFPELFDPVVVRDTINIPDPNMLRFKFRIQAATEIDKWTLKINQIAQGSGKKTKLFDTSANGDVPELLEWKLDMSRFKINPNTESLDYEFTVRDKNGDKKVLRPNIKFSLARRSVKEKRQAKDDDTLYSQYNYLMSSSNIVGYRQRYIDRMQADNINSTAIVIGYSDIENSDAAKRISLEWATEFGDELIRIKGLDEERVSILAGGHTDIYDNSKPEGRFYNRRVTIDIESLLSNKININFKCCYVLYISTTNKSKADYVLDFLIRKGFTDTKIESWIDPNDESETEHFRVRSECYDNVREAFKARAKRNKHLKELELKKSPLVLCDE